MAAAAVLGGALLLAGPQSWRSAAVLIAGLATAVQAFWLSQRARGDRRERQVWSWAAAAAAAAALGLLLDGTLSLAAPDGPLPGVAFALGGTAACALLYQGLLHWNRFKTYASDPGDWLNGLSAVAAVVAGGGLVVRLIDAPMHAWSELHSALWLTHVGWFLVMVGTTVTVANLGGLGRDRRVWWVAAAFALGAVVPVVAAATGDVALTLAWIEVCWILLVGVLSIASAAAPERPVPSVSSSQAPAVGALVVLVASVAVLIGNGLAGDVSRMQTTVLAGLASVGSALRMLRLVSDLAQLALSRQEALTDELTGMANRRALTAALAEIGARGDTAALLVIDLDRFKQVNDRYGHGIGDEVLRIVALRLQAELPGNSLLARVGGDEFAVLVRGHGVRELAATAESLYAACQEPLDVAGRRVRLGASIGAARGGGGVFSEELMRRADAAMYVAKHAGGGVNTYDEAADARARREHDLLEDLHVVLGHDAPGSAKGRLVVHLQPQLAVDSGGVVGAETLVRWEHPEHGLLFPDAFLDLVERHGLMPELTALIVRQAVREVAHWREVDVDLRLAVNLSASCLSHPSLLPLLDEIMHETGVDPALLVIEITETTLMSDPVLALEVVSAIAARGIAISIDDYGTGYSSLAYLNDLPAEELKLDRSFTARMVQDPRTAAIVAGTIDLAHHLGLRVVAEGVEDAQTLAALAALGCDQTQGYLHARPMPVEEFRSWLRSVLLAAPAGATEPARLSPRD